MLDTNPIVRSQTRQPLTRAVNQHKAWPLALVAGVLATVASSGAFAYIGPGVGMGVFGTLFGLVAALLLAIVGVFWYPLKRMMNRRQSVVNSPADVPADVDVAVNERDDQDKSA